MNSTGPRRTGVRHRAVAALSAFGVLIATAVVVVTVSAGPAVAAGPSSACTAAPTTQTNGAAISASETLCRYFADKGKTVDTRTFSVSVSDTTQLRNRQVISVSWTGAHPTGGIVSDEQLAEAATQEYPVVLMECHGVDSTSVPASQRLSPQTCWTATPDERTAWTNANPLWSLDMFNSPADQAPDVTPPDFPFGCGEVGSNDQYWVPFVAADGTNYPVGPEDCTGSEPPEMTNITPVQQAKNPTIVPSDTTYAETAPNGQGTANFTIETDETNASLGCSSSVPCSLVIVPIEGISCTRDDLVTSAPWLACESKGTFSAGEPASAHPDPAPAVEGSYWWSASNWQRHISVPLNFAPPADICSSTNTSTPVDIYGSDLMVQATQQWNPYFCLNSKLFNVSHVQLPEPAAKSLLQSGSVEAAFQGEPPDIPLGQKSFFAGPTVQAPVAVSGFAISYVIDNSGGQPYTQLQLDPRLLAKLLTESYPGTNNVASGDTGIAHNPISIIHDPEFLALNPSYKEPSFPTTPEDAPAATLFSILSGSDAISALTSYINADPEARGWLNGQPDPWGMVVNPAYKGIQLPVDTWPLLDTSTKGPDYDPAINPCLAPPPTPPGVKVALVPDRPLIDNPEGTLAQVAFNLQFSIAISETVCNPNPNSTFTLGPLGPETLGDRFLIGLVSLGAAQIYGLPVAALQTSVKPGSSAKFTDPTGRVFVGPTNATLAAAAALMQPDPDLGSWQLPYGDFPVQKSAVGAYPGTMLMSMDVPTDGLPTTDAKHLAEYLSFAATTGQAPGAGIGQLPAGYLPMTSANGLADEVAYTKAAAADVAAQNGSVPPLTPLTSKPGQGATSTTSTPAATTPTQSATPSASGGSSADMGSTSPSPTTGSENTSGGATGGPSNAGGAGKPSSGTPQPESAAKIEPDAAAVPAAAISSGVGGLALPLALLIALIGSVVVSTSWWLGRRRVK